jgi:hypothetical protein
VLLLLDLALELGLHFGHGASLVYLSVVVHSHVVHIIR